MSLQRRLEQLEASAPASSFTANSGNCEEIYFQELEWYKAGESGSLVHDPKTEPFYAPAGEFALSRHRVDIRVWLNA